MILTASAEQLFDDLDLPLNETMASWVVTTAYSQSESPMVGTPFVLLAEELCAIVTEDFSGVPYSEKQNLNRILLLSTSGRQFHYPWKFVVLIST